MITICQLFLICQRYENESNSQRSVRYSKNHIYVKDMKMKAIHNVAADSSMASELFLICQRYENESNSQRSS